MIADLTTGLPVADRLVVAATFAQRFLGLMGRRSFDLGEGLLLPNCRSVHTCFMHFPIDIIYLDRDMCVVSAYPDVTPWRFLPPVDGGKHTLELPSGALAHFGLAIGHQLTREAPG